MNKAKARKLADQLAQQIKRYEVLLEKRYNVGEILTNDQIQWMKDFNNPERHIQGMYHQLKRFDDPYIDMILNKFESLRRKEHGLSMVQKTREGYAATRPGSSSQDGSVVEFYKGTHRDTDTMVNDLILAIHKKSGGINPSTMDRYVTQIRKKVNKMQEQEPGAQLGVKAAVNRGTNQIEVKVIKLEDE